MNLKILGLIFAMSLDVVLAASQPMMIVADGKENSSARVEGVRLNDRPGIAVVFEGTKDLHYYASAETAPAEGLELKITAKGEGITFTPAVFPAPGKFHDSGQDKDIDVYVGNFEVYLPIQAAPASGVVHVEVHIAGIACTSRVCLPPFEKTITSDIDFSQSGGWRNIEIKIPEKTTMPAAAPQAEQKTQPKIPPTESSKTLTQTLADWKESGSSQDTGSHNIVWYLSLALLAGLSINIMPCVLPIIPLIVMRLISQAKESAPRRLAGGFAFCGGVILFFAMFAALSVAVKAATGTALDLNSIYRNPTAVITLFLLIVLFALVLMDVLMISLPSSLAGKQQGGSGVAASIGMGFFAGLLSTPCSGAIIGAVLVWAQTQPAAVSSSALILMGVGMAMPYAMLVSIPKLLSFVPKPGTWMEHFKKAGGFLLLLIAIKFMLAGLTKDHLLNVLMYGVVFAFCAWMWGGWVNFATPAERKWTTRIIAAAIAVGMGMWLLPAPEAAEINWQAYDAGAIQKAMDGNKQVLIKFTADWCTNCKVVDKNVFHDPQIVKLLDNKNLLTILADTTQQQYPAAVDLKAVFGEAGNVPVTILLNPQTKTITKLRGIFEKQQLLDIIPK